MCKLWYRPRGELKGYRLRQTAHVLYKSLQDYAAKIEIMRFEQRKLCVKNVELGQCAKLGVNSNKK